eukprot:8589139-Ditylum_brightwellii.AAC.2
MRPAKRTTIGNTTTSYHPADCCTANPDNINLPLSDLALPSAAAPSALPAPLQLPQPENHNNDPKSSQKSQNSSILNLD